MLNPVDIQFFKMCCPDIKQPENSSDIAAKCPICGDSKTGRKYRLHLWGENQVKCFNCGINTNMYGFLKNYYPSYLFQYKQSKFVDVLKSKKPEIYIDNQKFSTGLEDYKPEFQRSESKNGSVDFKYFSPDFLKPLTEDAKTFLKSRKIEWDVKEFGEIYTYNGDLELDNTKYFLRNKIIIPFYYNSYMYGFYSRDIFKKDFRTCNLNHGYKFWNYFNLDLEKPVYIFEGIFDAVSFYQMYGESNTLALCSNNIDPKILKEIKEPKFCLDNDTTGINTMLKYALKYDVLIYDNNLKYKDFNEALQNGFKIPLRFEKGLKAVMELKKIL